MTKLRPTRMYLYCTCACFAIASLTAHAQSDDIGIQFSHKGGVIRDGRTVSLKLNAPYDDVNIYYTLDGTSPTNEGDVLLYKNPIPIHETTLVRVVAMHGKKIVARDSRAYIWAEPELLKFDSNLPLIIVEAFGRDIDTEAQWDSRATRRPVFVMSIDRNERTQRAAMVADASLVRRAGMRVRGQTSSQFDKKQYSVELWDEEDDDRAASLLGMPPESDWVLYAPWLDKTLMRNVLAYRWFREMGHYSVRCRFVELFHNADGGRIGMDDYRGIYVLMEKIKRDSNRVDIAKLDATMTTKPEITGGYIFKIDKGTQNDANFDAGLQNIGFVEPKKPNETQFNYLRSHVNSLVSTLASNQFADPNTGYPAYIDVLSFIDVHIHVELLKNVDGFRFSTFLYKDRGQKIRLGPVWDYNLSLGNASSHEGDTPKGWYYVTIDNYEYLYFKRLFEDPNFELQYWDRYFELRKTVFDTDKLMGQIDDLEQLLVESQERNFERWPIFNRRLFRHPRAVMVRKTHREQVQWMKDWLQGRLAWMDQQFTPPPIIHPTHKNVTADTPITILPHVAPRPDIYQIVYTNDGSDPRQPNGKLSPQAKVWKRGSRLMLIDDVTIKSRLYVEGRWGALAKQEYRLSP